jgi:hypothetical protein
VAPATAGAADGEKNDGRNIAPLLETQAAYDKAKRLRGRLKLARHADVELLEAAQARQAAVSAMQQQKQLEEDEEEDQKNINKKAAEAAVLAIG